jgi:hypothetical protein
MVMSRWQASASLRRHSELDAFEYACPRINVTGKGPL